MMTKTLSHYEILAPIGEGGMGVVYRAFDTRLGRPVAVKVLRQSGPLSAEGRKRFAHEARAASALNHPHIVTIYDIGCDADSGTDFIAMEYVAGSSLAQVLVRSRPGVADVLKYAVQIADAVAAAHAAGILHRDLKPGNIMVSEKGAIKVLDFGLAKLTEPSDLDPTDEPITTGTAPRQTHALTEAGTILGTAAYMSPEQAEGKPADARSDIFAFGAVLYEMVTGRRAFNGATRMSTLAAVLTGEPEPPGRVIPGLSRDLDKLITRCLRKGPDRRWQSMADLKVALEDLRDEADARGVETTVAPETRRWTKPVVAAAATVGLGALLLGAWWLNSRTAPPASSGPFLTRLTSDVGWTDYPAISLDGKFLAYASDRSGEGHLDIWVQHLPDGVPTRLTRHPSDNVDPSFSMDGSRIAFQSSRLGGGIYVIPTLGGGEERLVAARGFSPRFSPDGNWLAYVVAEQGGGQMFVTPAAGGPATRVGADFYRAQAPVWSPDGRYLLFWAQRHRDAPPEANVDWYVAAVPGGAPALTGARAALVKEGFQAFQGLPFPDAWVGVGNRILFHGNVGDSSNMWQVRISPDRQISGAPQRATFGTTDEAAASVTADGRMAFISRTMGSDIWSLSIAANHAAGEGPLKRVTEDAADDYDPTLSVDGSTLVYRSRRAGRFAVVLRKIGSSAETLLTRLPEDHYPAISPDGMRVAYSVRQQGRMRIFVAAAGGGMPAQACDDCGEVEGWSADGNRILYVTAEDPSGVGLLNIGSSHDNRWLRDPGYGIYNARLSPDGQWVAFNGRTDRLAPAHVFVAKVQPSGVAAEKDWIVVGRDAEAPAWSPDGSVLYFWSNRDGSLCLWAQRLDPARKQPAGTPLGLRHFHSRGLSPRNLHLGAPGIAVAADRIVFNLGEQTGNIWMTALGRSPE